MYNNFFISAIILAAGDSRRMQLDDGCSKIFAKISGKPCLWYTLSAFSKCSFIDEIIVVCKSDHMSAVRSVSGELGLTVRLVTGGNSRQSSAFNGTNATDGCSDYLVLHDAARCLITKKLIMDVLSNAVKFGDCSVLGVPVKDTVKVVNKNFFVDRTLKRELLFNIQTPQVVKKDIYLKGLERAFRENKEFTDDSQIIENYTSSKVYITFGDYNNIKLTTPEDLVFAENFLKERENVTLK